MPRSAARSSFAGSSTSWARPDEHAPALAHRLVDLVDLEADSCACCRGERALRARAEEDGAVEVAEVDRHRDRPLRGKEDEAADAAACEMQLALLAAEDVEMRVRAGSPRTGKVVDVAASQERRSVSSAAASRMRAPAVSAVSGLCSR